LGREVDFMPGVTITDSVKIVQNDQLLKPASKTVLYEMLKFFKVIKHLKDIFIFDTK